MHPRWTLWTMAVAALLLGSAGAGAETAANASDVASDDRHAPPRLALHAEPAAARVHPGGVATYVLLVKSGAEQGVHLAVRAPQDGFRHALDADAVKAGPREPGKATLTVHAPDDARAGKATFVVVAEGEEGGRAETRLALVVVVPERPPARPCAEPDPAAATAATLRCGRNAATFALVLEPAHQRVEPGETVTYAVVAKSRAAQTLALDVALRGEGWRAWLDRESLEVGPDGRARAALHVHASENATREAKLVVTAKGADGEAHRASAGAALAPAEPALRAADHAGALADATPRPLPEEPCGVRLVLTWTPERGFRVRLSTADGLVEGDLGVALLAAMKGACGSPETRRMP